MINSPIRAIVITGHYAAGKGDVAAELLSLLKTHFPVLTYVLETDRDFLNDAVLQDVYDSQAPQPGIEGPHSIIRQSGSPLVFDVKDGTLHHEAHTNMVSGIPQTPDGTLRIMEIASGPDVPNFDLYQSGEHLVNLLDKFGAIDYALVVDVYAPFAVRLKRNGSRSDRVSREIMEVAATDGGEVFHVKHLLANRYYQLRNEVDGGLSHRTLYAFRGFIRPNLEATVAILEGNGGDLNGNDRGKGVNNNIPYPPCRV